MLSLPKHEEGRPARATSPYAVASDREGLSGLRTEFKKAGRSQLQAGQQRMLGRHHAQAGPVLVTGHDLEPAPAPEGNSDAAVVQALAQPRFELHPRDFTYITAGRGSPPATALPW